MRALELGWEKPGWWMAQCGEGLVGAEVLC